MHVSRLILATASILFCPLAALADSVTFTYTGNDFTTITVNGGGTSAYTTSDSIDGSITLASALHDNFVGPVVPTSYSFSSGVQTLNSANSTIDIIFFTSATGDLEDWIISIYGNYGGSYWTVSSSQYGDFDSVSSSNTTAYTKDPGTWSDNLATSPVPEPSTLALLGTGALGLITRLRRKP